MSTGRLNTTRGLIEGLNWKTSSSPLWKKEGETVIKGGGKLPSADHSKDLGLRHQGWKNTAALRGLPLRVEGKKKVSETKEEHHKKRVWGDNARSCLNQALLKGEKKGSVLLTPDLEQQFN